MIHNFAKFLLAPFLFISQLAGYNLPATNTEPTPSVQTLSPQMTALIDQYVRESQSVLGAATLPAALSTYSLAGSGVSSSASSITLQSFTLTQSPINQKLRTSDLTDPTFFLTIEPGSKTKQEIVGCTTVTQNTNGTATLSGCSRGLSPITPFTASTTLQFPHAGSSAIILSDPPQFHNLYGALANSETITGYWEAPDPVSAQGVATKNYVQGLAFGGIGNASETATGTVEIATGAEAVAGVKNGSLGRLALPADMASSTWITALSGSKIPITDSNGSLDGNYLSSTTNPIRNVQIASTTLSGNITLNKGTTTIYATTTIIDTTKVFDATGTSTLWTLIASSTLTASAATTTVSFPARRILHVVIEGSNSANGGAQLYFNGDFGNNYSSSGTTTVSQGAVSIPLGLKGGDFQANFDIVNRVNTRHAFLINSIDMSGQIFSSSTVAFPYLTAAVWATSTPQQVTSIFVAKPSGGTNIIATTTIYVFGSSF